MVCGQHVLVIVRTGNGSCVAGTDFFASDNDGDVDHYLALTLQLLYSEVEGAAEFAPTLVQKAAADFEQSRKWAKRMFPDIDVGEVVE